MKLLPNGKVRELTDLCSTISIMELGKSVAYLVVLYFSCHENLVQANSSVVGRDCLDLLHRGFNSSGLYQIDPDGNGAYQVLCDQETNGGGWVVIQKRFDGAVDFVNKNWNEYKDGFGNLSTEFWLGNDKLHRLSSMNQTLLVEIGDFNGEKAHASYNEFSVHSETKKYELYVRGYSGTTKDSFSRHSGLQFSTIDQDNDPDSRHCSQSYGGGWWFKFCGMAYLNGYYRPNSAQGILWYDWKKGRHPLKQTAMKLRTLRERPWDYYLSFTGIQSQDFAFIPVVLDFETLTVSWWMRGAMAQHWSAVFSIVNIQQGRTAAFSYTGDRRYKVTIDNNTREFNSEHSFADSKWHHLVLAWNVKSGNVCFYVDSKVALDGLVTQHSEPFPGGYLILGQLQDALGAINGNESLKADIMHFNMWQRSFTEQEIIDIRSDCSVNIGTLVPWPEMLLSLHGNVTRTAFVRCHAEAKYHWPLTEVHNNKLKERLTSRHGGHMDNSNLLHTKLGVLSREDTSTVSLGSYAGECVGNLDLCKNGLSLSFWMNYNIPFVSHILGLNGKHQDTLRAWLEPFLPNNARWHLCYRAVQYGFEAQTFHEKCQTHGATVTLVKVRNFVFGGFSDQRWGGTTELDMWSARSFLFSIVNPAGIGPVKLNIRPEKTDNALRQDPETGPVFGENDLHIGHNADQSAVSFSDLGRAYDLPDNPLGAGTLDARKFFAGSYKFIVDDIEVFYYSVNNFHVGLADTSYSANDTFTNTVYAPYRARPSSPDPWCSSSDVSGQWLTIDLGTPQSVNKIRLEKKSGDTGYVLTYTVKYKNDGESWTDYNNSQVLDGQNLAVVNISSVRFIRFYPKTWKNEMCMRVQVYKEVGSNLTDLGIDNSSVIPNSSFTASSWKCMSTPSLAYDKASRKCYAAWCGTGASTWLQIDMMTNKLLTNILTIGPSQGNPVTSFYLTYSLDGTTWQDYAPGGERQKLYGDWTDQQQWTTHAFLPPLKTRFLRILPHECVSPCCINVKLYKLRGWKTDYIIASGGEQSTSEGFAMYHTYIIQQNTSSYHLTFATESRRWSMLLPAVPHRWLHVTITWSAIWGLKYYEDGRLVKEEVNFELTGSYHTFDEVTIGRPPSIDSVYFAPLTFQISDLVFWYAFLTEADVTEGFSLSDKNRIWSYDQPMMDFTWQTKTNCTNTNDTGPCSGETEDFMYIESSFPRMKGDKARLESSLTVPTRNCLTFWYHMHGETTGRLNVYLRSHSNDAEILIWRLAGSHGNVWKKGEIPIRETYAYQVIIEAVVGGYHGDIAISDVVLNLNDSCSFTPKKALVLPLASGCRDSFGMASGLIPDERISASSQRNNERAASQGRLHLVSSGKKKGGWVAGKNNVNQWLQVDLGSIYTRVTGVATQGRYDHPQGVTRYKLQYGHDGASFQYYRGRGQHTDKEFTGNKDQNTVVSHDLNPPIITRYVRFRPVAWFGSVSMRVELYGCQECQEALGLQSGVISDGQISASSEWDTHHATIQGRLNFEQTAIKSGAWSSGTVDGKQWLQVDLRSYYTRVSRVATQGRNSYDQWVTEYQLQYGNNGVNFQYYREQGQTVNKDFAGNEDPDTVVYHDLNPPITARYIRFRPITWYGHISMRAELYGCQALECQDAFGMESGAITNGQISATSEYSASLAAIRGRLNVEHSPGKGGSWSAKYLDHNQWLQIDLGSQYTKVTRIATQGRSDNAQWVTKYMLQFSDGGGDFNDYKLQYHTTYKEFTGNKDQNTVVSHDLSPPIIARYVRFRPIEWHGHISMRAELYGCQECVNNSTDIVCELPCLPGQYCDEVTGQCVCNSSLRDEEWCWKRQRYVPLSIDKLQESATFYWTMDDEKTINNIVGSDFGVVPSDINTVKGVRGKAVNVKHGVSGKFTLTEGLDPSQCLFNTSQCNEGFTLMLWMWYKHNNSGQVFLASSEDNFRGHRMYQINGDTPQVAYQIANSHKKCIVVFSTPKEVWTHYALTYRSLDNADGINLFLNGEEVKNFVFKCSDGNFPISSSAQLSVGESDVELPEAAFDELIIWYRNLASDEIVAAFSYYKGSPNLQLHVNVDFTGTTWNERLSDQETDRFKDWSQRLTNHVQSLYHNTTGDVDVTIEKYWDASGAVGCAFAAKFTETGYSAVEPVINWLTESTYQINRLEANDLFIKAVSLEAHNAPKERSIDLSITWNGPTELLHGIFQGYEIFYRDTSLGKEFNVTLRTSDTFYKIHDLQHYTRYMVTARSFTLEGEGRMSEPIYVWTAATAPIHSPTNITSFSKTSTSLLVTWVTIPTQQGIGQVMGYTAIFFAVKDGNMTAQNVSVESGNLNETILDNLQKFTNYSIQVLGFTERDKSGPLSDPIYVMTDQDVPSLAPPNVTARAMNSSSIFVSWGPVPNEGRNGIIIGYGLFYTKHDSSRPDWKQQTCNNTYECAITRLDTYTRYDINVTGLTAKGFGVPALVDAVTEKCVSDQPPTNLTAHKTSSTSIHITWNLIPPHEKYIATKAYHVTMARAGHSSDTEPLEAILGACVNDTNMTLHWTNLRKYTAYRITVAGVTDRGFGKASEEITVLTDEDVPEGSLQNITPAAASATSLTFAWKPLTKDFANGVILGYHIILLDKLRNETRNITVQSLDQANIENLFPYTEYEARIVPFNSKGQGNASDVILVRTQEAAPSRPPSNLTGQLPSSTKVTLEWKPVDERHINGVLRAYVIVYFITQSPHVTRHNITIPVTNARKRRAITDPSSPSYELSGLKKYTTYTVQVMAYTVDYGVPSLEINITTAQDVPSRSPINVTAFNTSSTSINVTWEPVPDDHVNGIVLGYRLFCKQADKPINDFSNLTVNSTVLSIGLDSLEFYTKYELRLLAFTMVGDGNISEPVYCMTDEDVPESAPVNLLSLPFNETALTITWLPVIEEDRNGIILGYRVALSNSTGEFMRNISVLGSEFVTIGGLEVWTNYSMQVCAFTVKGNGPWSPIVRGITDEEAPRVAPTNITAVNTSSTSLHISWQPISTQGLRGIFRAYRVYYIEQETYFTRSLKNVTVDSATLEVELVDLYKFTSYTVYVVARTNKDGVSSEKVNVFTDEDKPDQAPADVEVWTPHSTGLDVSWNEVLNGYKNGIIRGYKVQYTEMMDNGSAEIEDLEPWKQSLSISGLKKFTLYNITVLAYTSKGDGVSSNKVIMTDQDVPDTPPLDIKAENTWTIHTIPLSWAHIPSYLLNGILTGYKITYQAIEIGECPHEENPREVILPPETTSTILEGLESFALYRIEVTGLTIKGDGPSEVIFAETCRCAKRLTTNWMLLDPYVTKDNSTKHGLGGLMAPFVNDMAVTCCQFCRTHGTSYVDFDFNGKGGASGQPTENAHRLNINHDTDFSFPVYGYKLQDKFRHEFGYTGMIESPGTAYIVNTKFGKELPTSLLDSILACWPLALLSILLAYISGITIWAMDQVQNSEHFPRSFFPGMWEGFWWAFVSMTTVGYGDRTPLSNSARLIAVLWTLTGVIIIGILVGVIAVSLTSVSVGVDYKLYGAKVAAIFGSAQYNMGVRKNAKFPKDQVYRSFEEIYEVISSNQVGGVLVDAYMVGSRKHLFEKPFLRIYRIYDYSAVYGVVTGGDSRKLGKCFHNYIQKNLASIYEHVADNVKAIQETPEPLEVERSTGLFDTESELFRNNLMILTVLLCCAFLGGILWEVLHRLRQKMKIQPQDDKPTTMPSFEMRKILEDYKTQTYNLIMELKEKHRIERRSVLRTMKNSRKFLYEQRNIVSANSQRASYEEEDLTTGLVALSASRKAMILTEHQQDRPNYNLVRVSFHIPDKTSEEETKC